MPAEASAIAAMEQAAAADALAAAPAAPVEAPPVAETPAAKPEPVEPKKGKGKGKEAPAPPAPTEAEAKAAELEQLKAKIKEFGYDFDDTKISYQERIKFRDEKRRERAAVEAYVAKRRSEIDAEAESHKTRLSRAQAIDAAVEAADYETLAQLTGHKSWNELQDVVIKKLADPNYRELQELKRKQAERERVDAETKQRAEQEARNSAIQRAQDAHRAELSLIMRNSSDPLVREMHDDPNFVNAVFIIQQENWDGRTTVSPEKAIKMAARGRANALGTELEQLYKRLHRVYGQPAAPTPAPDEAAGKKPAAPAPKKSPGKTGVVSASAEAAPNKKDWESEEEWRRYAAAKMRLAALEDRKSVV